MARQLAVSITYFMVHAYMLGCFWMLCDLKYQHILSLFLTLNCPPTGLFLVLTFYLYV